MDRISAHGKLQHAVMSVKRVCYKGIIKLIMNSPSLLTLIIVTHQYAYRNNELVKHIKDTVKKRFPYTKLFSVGNFRLHSCGCGWNMNDFLYDTDLLLLWL